MKKKIKENQNIFIGRDRYRQGHDIISILLDKCNGREYDDIVFGLQILIFDEQELNSVSFHM